MKPQVIKKQIESDELCRMMKKVQLKAIEYGSVVTTTSNNDGEKFTHLYRLNYIVEGSVFYTCCTDKMRIDSGNVVYLPPGSILEIDESETPVVLFFVNFEIENINERQNFNQLMGTAVPNYHVRDRDNLIRHLFNQLFDEANKGGIGYCMCVQGIFYNLMIHFIRLAQSFYSADQKKTSSSSPISYFNQAIHFINKNISQNIKIKDIAAHVGVSEIYLYKLFMKYSQKAPIQFLINYRIQLAQNYLRNPNLSIKTISSELGFSSPNQFSVIFKKHTGQSPKHYRQSLFE